MPVQLFYSFFGEAEHSTDCPHDTLTKMQTSTSFKREGETSLDFHSLILLAGWLEQNPRPTYPCLIYGIAYSRRRGMVQCALFQQWLCLSQHCSLTRKTLHSRLNLAKLPVHNTAPLSVEYPLLLQTPLPSQSAAELTALSFLSVHLLPSNSVPGNKEGVLSTFACQDKVSLPLSCWCQYFTIQAPSLTLERPHCISVSQVPLALQAV